MRPASGAERASESFIIPVVTTHYNIGDNKGGGIMKYNPPGVQSETLKGAMRAIVSETELKDEIMHFYKCGDGKGCLKAIELYQILYDSE